MKRLSKLKGIWLPVIMMMAALNAHCVLAGSYSGVVNPPVLPSTGDAHEPITTISNNPPAEQLLEPTRWNWNVHGWPRDLPVFLCSPGVNCLNTFTPWPGTTDDFNRFQTNKQFYFELKLPPTEPAPVGQERGWIAVA